MRMNTVFAIVSLVATMGMTACKSQEEAFRDAALPIATNIHLDMLDYTAQSGNTSHADRNATFIGAVEVGNRDYTSVIWFGHPPFEDFSFRDVYIGYLDADEVYNKPFGEGVRTIKKNNITVFERIMNEGNDQ